MSTRKPALGFWPTLALDLEAATGKSGSVSTRVQAILSVRFLAVVLYRLSSLTGQFVPAVGSALKQVNHVLSGADIAWNATIGPGIQLFHPTGVVIGADCRVGDRCSIQQGVTLGAAWSQRRGSAGSPVIGDDVRIGPGARILGEMSIGDGTTIGSNAVVTADVPANVVAKGIPARW